MQFTQTQDLNKTLWITKETATKNRKRYKINAAGVPIGRLATVIADRLTGKDKAHYCKFFDMGACLVVENVDQMTWTGRKGIDKMYYRHSGYKGNLKEISLEDLFKKDPSAVLEKAVRGMLPDNKHRKKRLQRLKIHVGTTNQYDNLSPQSIDV